MSKKRDKLKKARRRERAFATAGGHGMDADGMNANDPHSQAPPEPAPPEPGADAVPVPPEAEPPAERATGGAPEPVGHAFAEAQDAASDAVTATAERSETVAARSADAIGSSLAGSADAVARYNAKLLDIVQVNVAAAGAHASALAQAKSVPEAMAINADHVRRQIETLTGQGRELTLLAQRIALESLQPLRSALKRR